VVEADGGSAGVAVVEESMEKKKYRCGRKRGEEGRER
jgi:hypothetical protein